MKKRTVFSKLWIVPVITICVFSAILIQGRSQDSPASQAKEIFEKSGIQGGLIVHINCGDGILTEALQPNDSYLVQGLDQDIEDVQKARKYITSKNKYGPVSVLHYSGTQLPYKTNLVSMVVAEDLGKIPQAEVMRVLAPNGVLMTKGSSGWKKTVKPVPAALDEWNQYLYDSSNNPVSSDTEIGPVRTYQWIGSPNWGRHHDTTASMSAMVSANGRIFYIMDEGPKVSVQLPAENYLVARDAYNGTILWKKPIKEWFNHLFPLKSGPAYLPRRLVALGDRVYVTLGIDAALSELDAATGKVLRTFPGTEETSEILYSDNILFLLIGRPEKSKDTYAPKITYVWDNADWARSEWAWNGDPGKIMAIDRSSGKTLWTVTSPVVPVSMAADSKALYFCNTQKLVSLDRSNGKERWQTDQLRSKKIDTGYVPRTLVKDGVVLFSASQGFGGNITAFSAENGKQIWQAQQPASGHYAPMDTFIVNGVVWMGETANINSSGKYTGLDLHTGKQVSEIAGYNDIYYFHQRCYISKATEKFLLPSRTGIEFVSLEKKNWDVNHYTRGGCYYGILPSNGLIYTPPNACTCYVEAELHGLNALAPASDLTQRIEAASKENRLEKGPAYNAKISDIAGTGDWPTYRHDTKRSSFTTTKVSPEVQPQWKLKLGGKLSSPVVVGNQLFISQVDAHAVHSIDASTGKHLWQYTVGGRVNSPPTIYKGRVLFGSMDGYVYCLNAADGALIWRFRAAPMDLRMVAYEQVESVWPVDGSVLIQDGKLYCVAGRSMFMDGGMRFLRLNPLTGEKISETVMNEINPETGENLQKSVEGLSMPVGLPDILSSDGKYLYMRSQQFDLDGTRKNVKVRDVSDQTGEGAHIFSPVGFLDDSEISRSYMMYGKSMDAGWGQWETTARITPAGRLIAMDNENVYGFSRKPEFLSESIVEEYQLYAANKTSDPEAVKKAGTNIYGSGGLAGMGGGARGGAGGPGARGGATGARGGAAGARGGATGARAGGARAGGAGAFGARAGGAAAGGARAGGAGAFGARAGGAAAGGARAGGARAGGARAGGARAGGAGARGGGDAGLNLFRASGDWKLRQGLPMDYQTALSYKWKMDKPEIQARALVVAGDTLFVAGPPDVVDEEEAFFAMNDKDVIAKLAKQSEALKGKYGASLWAVSALKGQKLYEYKLDTLPVWDGMIAAGGKLYLSTTDGEVACLTGKAN